MRKRDVRVMMNQEDEDGADESKGGDAWGYGVAVSEDYA